MLTFEYLPNVEEKEHVNTYFDIYRINNYIGNSKALLSIPPIMLEFTKTSNAYVLSKLALRFPKIYNDKNIDLGDVYDP
jgi:hypothetical protein